MPTTELPAAVEDALEAAETALREALEAADAGEPTRTARDAMKAWSESTGGVPDEVLDRFYAIAQICMAIVPPLHIAGAVVMAVVGECMKTGFQVGHTYGELKKAAESD